MSENFDDPHRIDGFIGSLLGLAVGDALGMPLEFSERDSLPRVERMIGGGSFRLPAGCWTDDTAMALGLAESLVERQEFDPYDVMLRWLDWRRNGTLSPTGRCFGLGKQTRKALARFAETGDPVQGPKGEADRSGNGGIMRLSPAVIFGFCVDPSAPRDERIERAVAIATRQSELTHGSQECRDAALLLATVLCRFLLAPDLARDDGLIVDDVPFETSEIASIAVGDWRGKPRVEIDSSGRAVNTLEAALWAVGSTTSFRDALVLAVNLGLDADTVGAVTGQIAGAIYGASAIPDDWLAALLWRDRLSDVAERLVERKSDR